MSHKTYDEKFRGAQEYLGATLSLEPSQADRREQRRLLCTLYIRYIIAANKFSECVDQMVQVQKRMLIKKLLEATLGRILELKFELTEADLCEFTHTGDVLEHMNLTPLHTELQVPSCFRLERKEDILYKKRVIEEVLDKLGFSDKLEVKQPMSEQKAILIIQTHERARQGRLRAQFMKEVRNVKEKAKPAVQTSEELQTEEERKAGISLPSALRIQKIWRGYVARRATRRRKLQEMILIGMIPPPKTKSLEREMDENNKERRRKLQEERLVQYNEAVKTCREYLEKNQRASVLEQLSDQVRNWLSEYKAQTGKIPEYTGSERTGSRQLMSRQGTDSELSKSTQISSKESKSKKDKSKSKDGKGSEAESEETGSRALVSCFVPELNIRKEEYDDIWKNRNEEKNLSQMHCDDIIEHQQMNEMENDLRKVVDEMMRSELILLQEALDRDRGHKAKKKASKKTRRGGKKSKKKKEKDLTPDRTPESLFEELVANGIIKKIPQVHLESFKGERSFNYPVEYNKGAEPKIELGDLRQIIQEYCIVPLMTNTLHQGTQHIKSILIAGAKGSGKDHLVKAICTEAGATLFDLTPANIVGKYPGKSGLIMLMHLVLKVSRILQPSIIYMDNAERPFVKKIPKTDKTDPKRLKKDLPKFIKNLSPEDRVMLIGVTSSPWDSDQKLLQQVYQKFILIPKPAYSSRFCLWTHFLDQYSAISYQFDTGLMAKISDGYTTGSIQSAIQEVMTVKRVLQLRIRPLSPLELINTLCKATPIYKEEEEAMELWWSKTPMVRRRLKAVETLQEEEAEMLAKQANAKKK